MLRLIQIGGTNPRNKLQNLAKRYNLQVSCRVKPNASGGREGITAVGDEKVDVFNVAKSDVGVIHGLKSRDKVLCISSLDIGTESEEEFLRRAGQQLQDAVIKK
ncbi:hypothetical protein BDW75DRAFT_236193 [Aspergillus navahoensis]